MLFEVGQPPAYRVHGELRYQQADRLEPPQTEAVARHVWQAAGHPDPLGSATEVDLSFAVPGFSSYRVNIYRQRGSGAVAMRATPLAVAGFEELGLPRVARSLAELERGMVLVVGAAGNGKSTSLACMVAHLDRTRRAHVVTIEDPIEYVHTDALASISQREIRSDTPDFPSGLRAPLRQDPDVILVGEIRDEQTMDIALKAAETSHLVLSTLHTPAVPRTIGRVLALSGTMDPKETRERLADNLEGIIAQRLLPTVEGTGRALAREVLVVTGTARDSIEHPHGNLPLKDVMERGVHPYGMQTSEMSLRDLVDRGRVSLEVARAAMG